MLCNVVLLVTNKQVCSQCDHTLAHARPKNVPVILAGVISEVRKEDVLVCNGYDCRKESQTTPYPQLGSAGVGFAVSLKCIACLVLTTWILCWRDICPRQCDSSARAGIFLAMIETAILKQQ